MNAYVESVIDYVKQKHSDEPEFAQTVEEVFRNADHIMYENKRAMRSGSLPS